MPEYTVAAAAAILVIIAVEQFWLRTGLFRRPTYWVAMIIVFGFQILVDGWLTKLSAPVVIYADDQNSGVRFPWDIPIEDFAYGFALVTLTLLLWVHGSARDQRASAARSAPSPGPGQSPAD